MLTPGDAALRGGSSSRGGSGGNRVAYITLPSLPEPAPVVPKATPPVRAPTALALPVPEPAPVLQPSQAAEPGETKPGTAGLGPAGNGGGSQTGGAGQGHGGGADSGSGRGRALPPEPRDMAFPFDTPPKELRGVSLSVTFWVRVDGRVERYEVVPEIKDRDYARKFDEVMRAFRFTPARAPDGTRVAGTTKISFTLPGKSSS
ncbi:MAG: hypothetical protein ACJ8BF_05435 [Gemmatimonadales bacterium]